MKKIFLFILCTLLVLSTVEITAEVKIPHEFKSGEVAKASEVNANFAALKEAIEQLEQMLQQKIAELEAKDRSIQSLEKENQTLKESITELKTRIETLEKSLSKFPTISQRISLRNTPLTVSEEEFKEVFRLDENQRPRKYTENDYEDLGDVITDHATGLA
jgi:chromosome segregation ATPase